MEVGIKRAAAWECDDVALWHQAMDVLRDPKSSRGLKRRALDIRAELLVEQNPPRWEDGSRRPPVTRRARGQHLGFFDEEA